MTAENKLLGDGRKMSIMILVAIVFLILLAAAWAGRHVWLSAKRLVRPSSVAANNTPADFGVDNWEDVTFSTGDVQLGGWFIPPSGADGATLLFVHGYAGNRSALMNQAAMMQQRGFGAFLIDLRNHGASTPGVTTWGYDEVEDVKAAVAYLKTRPEVNAARIGLVGKSMGGATIIMAADEIPETQVIVAEATYYSFPGNVPVLIGKLSGAPSFLAPLSLWTTEQMTGAPLGEVHPIDAVPDLQRPILFMHGEADDIVDPSHSQRMFDVAAEPKELYLAPGADHQSLSYADAAEFETTLAAFLNTYLLGE